MFTSTYNEDRIKKTFNIYYPKTDIEVLRAIGYLPKEITRNTYIYIDTDGNLCGIEKYRVDTEIADEAVFLFSLRGVDSIHAVRQELAFGR